ncbi:MAG: ATP-binding cassette domain-containing protein [Gammaproteobacteria bacterium]|nr:ATP-binding cassette domain-containing protein [Gammaproteobacteria bacterium]MDD9799807.1 ATP-binding cassette domain-containing protein [Gammaproteobacteria bacterium]MDD9814437.1 ATP-binding cassette domain-containing protein [Gammaproteobacteria bacterium]MDD9851327.1 ATP-binding cassette domain-containing protein [Gammaproteobacteria bacterium]MDD9871431.1 ATP-binding cassette domain-containing protein [Gammaproteobacteria bacterium]
MISASGLRKSYNGREAVCGVDFSVAAGACAGLLGPNGAGKTTVIRMILGQSPLSGGELAVFGMAMPAAAVKVRARTGVVPQLDNLDPDFTAAENLETYARYFGIKAAEFAGRKEALLDFAALGGRGDARIETLSGGMRRRLSIARALVNDPQLIVLDEPTTGLDPQARHLIWARLRQLRQQGKTMLLTTHYMEEAERLCDEVFIMDTGRIIARGAPKELIRRTVEPHVFEVEAAAGAAAAAAETAGARVETVGDVVLAYSAAPETVAAALKTVAGADVLHRPASLEDVFLRLTGRGLRD